MPVAQPVAICALLLAMLLWGSSFVALKIAFAAYASMWVIFVRMSLVLLCFSFFYRRVMRFNYRAGDGWRLLCLSLTEPCLYFIFEAQALQHTSAAQAGMIVGLLPLLVALLAHFCLKEQINRWIIGGSLLALIGVAGLSLLGQPSAQAPNPMLGNLLELAAIICAAAYCVQLKALSSRYSPVTLTALQGVSGTLFFLPLALLQPVPAHIDWPAISAICYLGVVVTCGAYLCYNTAISRVPVSVAGTFSSLIPVFALIIAWLVLDERLSPMQLLCALLVIIGVLLSQRKRGLSSTVQR